MKILSIGSDRKLFEEGSAVRARAIEYASLFDELHIIVFNNRFKIKDLRFKSGRLQIAGNAWIYPTNSLSRWLYIFDAIRIGSRIVRDSRFVIHDSVLTAQDPFECGFVASRIARRFNLPLHIQIHTDFLSPYFTGNSLLNRIRLLIARKVLPRANAIRVVSARIKNSLLQATNYKLQAVPMILPIFTDVQQFVSTQPSFDLKQKYPQWEFIILVAGRLSSEKNVGFALRVFRELLKKYPKIGMVIVGSGPLGKSLQLVADSLKLRDSIAFESWQSDLAPYYKTADLFLFTSLYEGFGLTLLEAVASGCPTVSSDVGVASELLNHKGRFFVCPVNDFDCFVRKASELIENDQLREFFSAQIAPSATLPFIKSKEEYLKAYKVSIESAVK